MFLKIYLTIVVAYFTLKICYSRLKTSNNFIINLLWVGQVRADAASLPHIIMFEEDSLSIEENGLPEHSCEIRSGLGMLQSYTIFKHN